MALAALQALARRVTPLPASALPDGLVAGTAEPAGSNGALAPEVFDPAALSPLPASDAGFEAWWLALPGAAIALAAGAVLARRRRRDPPRAPAGAVG